MKVVKKKDGVLFGWKNHYENLKAKCRLCGNDIDKHEYNTFQVTLYKARIKKRV